MKNEYLSTFLKTWAVLLVVNQLLIFGCLAPYCIIAGLVPTGVVAFIVTLFITKNEIKISYPEVTSENDEPDYLKDLDSEKRKEVEKFMKEFRTSIDDLIDDDNYEKKEEIKPKTGTQQKYKEKAQNKSKIYEESEDHLKKKGDQYEKYIGMQFEKKGELVIYNGFIRGYDDDGVDIITVCTKTKTIHLIQCKNWTKKSMVLDDVKIIYDKLENFRLNKINHKAKEIQEHLQEYKSYENIEYVLKTNKSDYDIRKTLYVGSDKVIDLNIGKHLKLIKPTIFRYEDMKIVIKRLGR